LKGTVVSAATIFLLIGFSMILTGVAQKEPFTSEETARLERGEVVLKHVETKLSDTEQLSRAVGSVLILHPAEVIWEVVDHPEREKEWIPYVKQSAVVSDVRPTATTRVNITDYRVAAFGVEVYYSLVREYDYQARTIKGHLDKSRPHKYFIDVTNGWNFIPYGKGIIFQYWSDSKLTINLPRVLSDTLAEKQLAAGVVAIRKRCDFIAEEMKRRSPGTPP
jgi:ribosome-associated toxin RatA of RatAB toxin-antitoxin module